MRHRGDLCTSVCLYMPPYVSVCMICSLAVNMHGMVKGEVAGRLLKQLASAATHFLWLKVFRVLACRCLWVTLVPCFPQGVSLRRNPGLGAGVTRSICAEGDRQGSPAGPRLQEGGEGPSPSFVREWGPHSSPWLLSARLLIRP